MLTEGAGVPIGLVHDGANRHDMKLLEATLVSMPIARPIPTPSNPTAFVSTAATTMTPCANWPPSSAWSPTFAPAARSWPRRSATPAGAPVLGRRGLSLVDEPQPCAAHPLVQEAENHLALMQLAAGLIALKKAHAQEGPCRHPRSRPTGIGLQSRRALNR